MEIGIGVPNSLPGTTGAQLLEWAKRADSAGFSSLATIGAVAYTNYEELTVLGAAAAVTGRIRLLTNVLIAPARSTAELAKQAATVDQLSNGRLTLGLGVGWRDMDYTLTGRDFDHRGDLFDEQLAGLQVAWRGEALTEDTRPPSPRPVQETGIPILVGGGSDAAVRRVVEHGIGWTAGGMPPDVIGQMREKVRSAWQDAGREGEPRIVALLYYSLGDVEQESRENLEDYYIPRGSDVAEMIAGSALRDAQAIKAAMQAYEDVGVDELVLDPSVADVDQVDRLAEVVM